MQAVSPNNDDTCSSPIRHEVLTILPGCCQNIVSDGGKWIADQVEEQFGANGTYLIDFFHLGDYLSEAAPKNEDVEGSWYKEQKALLKMGQAEQVVDALKTRIEPGSEEEPVYKCYR